VTARAEYADPGIGRSIEERDEDRGDDRSEQDPELRHFTDSPRSSYRGDR
jgi:hypothetical protein